MSVVFLVAVVALVANRLWQPGFWHWLDQTFGAVQKPPAKNAEAQAATNPPDQQQHVTSEKIVVRWIWLAVGLALVWAAVVVAWLVYPRNQPTAVELSEPESPDFSQLKANDETPTTGEKTTQERGGDA